MQPLVPDLDIEGEGLTRRLEEADIAAAPPAGVGGARD